MAIKSKNPLVKPILKWVGGKRQLLEEIVPLIYPNASTYVEPFIGGGSVLFATQPKKAIINDDNKELINVYKVIKSAPEDLIALLNIHSQQNSSEYFYDLRSLDRTADKYEQMNEIEKAARIIFLNKTCYNGLYRVNSSGQFNTPYGKYKNPNIVDATTIRAISHYFNTATIKILEGDYKKALKGIRKGAFVYLDPPYMPISESSSFTGYTAFGFDINQQEQLRDECIKLHNKGIKFLQSNSDCEEIKELYSDRSIFKIKHVQARRNINSKATKRGAISEVLIYNDF